MKLETCFSGIKPNPTQWLDDFRNRFFPKAYHSDIKLPQKLFLAGRKNNHHMLELWSRHRCRTHAANIRRVPALCKLRRMLLVFGTTAMAPIRLFPYHMFEIETVTGRIFARFVTIDVVRFCHQSNGC